MYLKRSHRLGQLIVTLALLLLAVGAFAVLDHMLAEPAYAGWNGQQVGIYCNTAQTKVDRMIISGTNQYGQHAYYDGAPSDAATTWSVWGWWWKGKVLVAWRYSDGSWNWIETTIPKYHPLDLYTVARC